jgi:hypothetical protein
MVAAGGLPVRLREVRRPAPAPTARATIAALAAAMSSSAMKRRETMARCWVKAAAR